MKEKNTKKSKNNDLDDELRPEYDFDYSKSIKNPFAKILKEQENYVKLDADVKKVFKTSEQVNKALRAILSAYPVKSRRTAKTL